MDCLTLQDAAAWLEVSQQQQQQSQQLQPTVQHPRHARVNLLKASVKQVLTQLQGGSSGGDGSGSSSSGKRGFDVHVDELLPDLLVFPPGTDLHDHPLVTEGVLMLQVRVGDGLEREAAHGIAPATVPMHACWHATVQLACVPAAQNLH